MNLLFWQEGRNVWSRRSIVTTRLLRKSEQPGLNIAPSYDEPLVPLSQNARETSDKGLRVGASSQCEDVLLLEEAYPTDKTDVCNDHPSVVCRHHRRGRGDCPLGHS